MASNHIVIQTPPEDIISSIQFSPHPGSLKFLVASWDRNAYLYEIIPGNESQCRQVATFEHRAPVLDVCFGKDDTEIFTAGLDWDVRRINVTTSEQTVLSTHNAGVRSVVFDQERGLLISAGWDCTLHIHNTSDASSIPASIPLPSKPFSISVSKTRLVVAMAARALHIYELQSLSAALSTATTPPLTKVDIEPWQRRESSLKFMTRAVSCMPNDEAYASSSIEGRVAVEWFDPSKDAQARNYAFKCHRQNVDGIDVVYPVHALAFHPTYGTFASGGGDGIVALWDAVAKRRIRQYQKYPSGIAALAFNTDGKYLVIGISPGFEDGKEEITEGSIRIHVRELGETEAKAKSTK
ncbi:putative nuclear pore complex subunit [Phaeomoniella chlamydospora]|uniref:Putative nuclear pore complex subunit n=1 Tax=Phaeomoniella chlamydospora TaxID=158046 RepID=A0A0G2EZA5_PHACM|nr:putative nuclear pore complex subunit [Phaeomoniella chlamydospora]